MVSFACGTGVDVFWSGCLVRRQTDKQTKLSAALFLKLHRNWKNKWGGVDKRFCPLEVDVRVASEHMAFIIKIML